MPRKAKPAGRAPVTLEPATPQRSVLPVSPLSPLGREALFNRNGSATYGSGGRSFISSAIFKLAEEGIRIEYNCDDLRTMINKMIKSRDMNVKEFQQALQVSAKAWYAFMKHKGAHVGLGTPFFKAAHQFFVKREEDGLENPKTDSEDEEMDEDGGDDGEDNIDDDVEVISVPDNSNEEDEEGGDKENGSESTGSTRYNCNQIRTKITAFISNGGMEVSEFYRELGVPARSYHSFMKQKGPHAGVGNKTYQAAHQFFVKREEQGLKIPTPKSQAKAKATAKDNPTPKGNSTNKDKATPNSKTTDNDKYNYESLPIIPDEEEGEVEIYDTCDDIRRKISAHLRLPTVTQASFCRELSKCQGGRADRGGGKGGPLQSVQLQSFLRKKGSMAGNTSKAFYTAYVYFEKLRVRNGKRKSKKREEMEEIWGVKGGLDTKNVTENMHYICSASAKGVGRDAYGLTRVVY